MTDVHVWLVESKGLSAGGNSLPLVSSNPKSQSTIETSSSSQVLTQTPGSKAVSR